MFAEMVVGDHNRPNRMSAMVSHVQQDKKSGGPCALFSPILDGQPALVAIRYEDAAGRVRRNKCGPTAMSVHGQ
jgi:hypothetical protein